MNGLARFVRRHDPDRFLCTLFAPAEARETLFLLYALNHELARAAEVTSNAELARIRLAWWREVVAGARRQHELAAPLHAAIAAGHLERTALLELVEARETELDPSASAADWLGRLDQGPGALAVAAGTILGASIMESATLRRLGAGYGGAGQLRTAERAPHRLPPTPDLPALAVLVRDRLGPPSKLRAGILAAGLPAVLARRDLRYPGQLRPRGFADRAAVTLAALRGRA